MEPPIAKARDFTLIKGLIAIAVVASLASSARVVSASDASPRQAASGFARVVDWLFDAVLGRFHCPDKTSVAGTDLHTLENCLDLYKVDKGRYPSTAEGLEAVVAAGKCKPLRDPWGREYVYAFPGRVHPDSFDVKSYGADGKPGGDGENADIVNSQ